MMNRMPEKHAEKLRIHGADGYFVALLATVVVLYAVLWAFFAPLIPNVDDLGLFNPVYEYLRTGSMSVPCYGFYYSVVIQPPTQLLLFGWLMKAGVPLQYVGSVLPFLLIVLTVVLLVSAKFSSEIKLALLFGFFAGAIFLMWRVGPTSFGLRPDLHLAFALFAGLTALESGRLQSWSPLRLGLGAFLLTYASGLHYPASIAWMGILVYLVWLTMDWRKQGPAAEKSALQRGIYALLLGSCAFGIPYLLLFIVPDWHQIIGQIKAQNAAGGIHASLLEHIQAYRSEYSNIPPGQFARVLYAPLGWGFPTVLISTALLVPVKQTRGLALASLPYLLSLLLFAQRKIDYRYLLLEWMLYVCSLSVLFALLCRFLFQKLWPQGRRLLVPVVGLVLTGALILGLTREGAPGIELKPRQDTLTVARAAGRKILGPGALVGMRTGRFYVDGGDMSYLVEPDLLYGYSAHFDLKEYFGKFDAIAEDDHWSDVTSNDMHESLTSWYSERLLGLRGFFFSHTGIQYLLLKEQPTAHLEGYELRPDGHLLYLTESADGDWVFVTAVCDADTSAVSNLGTLFHSSFLLPKRTPVQKQLAWFAMGRNQYEQVRPHIVNGCAIRDEVPMAMDVESANLLLLTLKNDAPIRFYRYLDEALASRYGPETVIAVGPDGWPAQARFLRGRYQGESFSLVDGSAEPIFRSATIDGWFANLYASHSAIKLLKPDMKGHGDCFEFHAADPRDHLATPYFELPSGGAHMFFSIWAKPEQREDYLNFSIQDDEYHYLAHASPVIRKPDGWILFAGWFEAPRGSVRAIIQQKLATRFLLAKALIVSISPSPVDRTSAGAAH